MVPLFQVEEMRFPRKDYWQGIDCPDDVLRLSLGQLEPKRELRQEWLLDIDPSPVAPVPLLFQSYQLLKAEL